MFYNKFLVVESYQHRAVLHFTTILTLSQYRARYYPPRCTVRLDGRVFGAPWALNEEHVFTCICIFFLNLQEHVSAFNLYYKKYIQCMSKVIVGFQMPTITTAQTERNKNYNFRSFFKVSFYFAQFCSYKNALLSEERRLTTAYSAAFETIDS